MAVAQTIETKTLTTIQETAATRTILLRTPVETPEGVQIVWGAEIEYATTQYTGDSSGKPLEVLRTLSYGKTVLDTPQVVALFSTPVTLQDGTKTYLGELLATLADQQIEADMLNKAKLAITPGLVRGIKAADGSVVVSVAQPVDGVTYAWEIIKGSASASPAATSVTLSGAFPATVRCTASKGDLEVTADFEVI